MSFVAWPEIEGFHHVRRSVVKYPELLKGREIVRYNAKVKLHGTNAGIFCRAGRFTAQSRTTVITSGNDNAGFAAWVESQPVQEALADAYRKMPSDLVIYGEWFGPGVQKGVAACQVPKRSFAVFAARLLDKHGSPSDNLITDPTALEGFVAGVPDAYALPWYSDRHLIEVPWLHDASELEGIVTEINEHVKRVEECDPWIEEMFGVKGTGEGLVYYPLTHTGLENFSNLCFKAKGEKHRVIAHSKPAQVDATVVEGTNAFADLVLTDARLEQGARFVNRGEFKCEPRLTGPFLAWVSGDIQKECEAELEAAKLTWKQVQKTVSERARTWYIEKAKAL